MKNLNQQGGRKMNKSAIVIDPPLKIFDALPINQSFTQVQDVVIRPLDGWQAGNTIDFELPKYENKLYESDSFEIHMTSSIVNDDGSAPDDTVQAYAPANGVGFTAFSSASVQIGNEFICGDNKYDVYKNYLEYLLGHSKEAKDTWMKYCLLYMEDDPGQFDDTTIASRLNLPPENPPAQNPPPPNPQPQNNVVENNGGELLLRDDEIDMLSNAAFNWKHQMYVGETKVKTVAKLLYPLSQTKKVLPPGLNMRISLNKNEDKWILLTDPPGTKMKFKIEDIYMTARVSVPVPQIFEQIVKQLIAADGFARYPFLRSSIAGPFHLPTTQTEFQFTIFNNYPPSSAFIFCIEAEACKGSFSKNPLLFLNPRYRRLALEVEGQTYPTNGYNFGNTFTPDVSVAQCKQAYQDLFKVLQQQYGGANCGLTYEAFLDGATVIGIQLSGKIDYMSVFYACAIL